MDTEKEPKAVIGTNSWGSAIYEKTLRGSSVDKAVIRRAAERAAEIGITVFDTAQDYGFGKAQKMIGSLCPDTIRISAKYTPMKGKYTEGQVRTSLEKDLTDFKRDHVDYYWLHLPNAVDGNLREIAELYREGKILHIGVSNFDLKECREAKRILDEEGVPLYGVQNHYSLIAREWDSKGVTAWCRANGLSFWAWAVLEEGLLAAPKKDETMTPIRFFFRGKRKKLEPLYREMRKVENEHGLTSAQVAMAYVANQGLVPICGCRKPDQVAQLKRASEAVLSKEEMEGLTRAADKTGVKILGADMFRFAVRKG